MSIELERTLESLLFLSAGPVDAAALADATGTELHEVVTALELVVLAEALEPPGRGAGGAAPAGAAADAGADPRAGRDARDRRLPTARVAA